MCCSGLASGLQSKCLLLKELDVSNNDLKDSGVKLLCEGLRSPHCTLETLSLSGCLITKEGCADLVSSLKLNPSHLKKLDLSYNHLEECGVKHFSAGQKDLQLALQTLTIEPSGSQFLKPDACELMLDPNSTHKNLILSDNNRKVTVGGEQQPYPDHPERFDVLEQLLCTDGLTGRCYWEVEWRGRVDIAVTYRRIERKGENDDCRLGKNDESWSLLCSDDGHSGLHKNEMASIYGAPSNRVGVYLDWPGGILSFFAVSPGKINHLHTFHAKFTEPVYPAFRITTEPKVYIQNDLQGRRTWPSTHSGAYTRHRNSCMSTEQTVCTIELKKDIFMTASRQFKPNLFISGSQPDRAFSQSVLQGL
ncbi:hypothetical protein CCH79_00010810, partial [Gambusia affinis]